MKVFPASTTTTTIGNGSEPRGSTELDAITGHNCAMTKDNYTIFAIVVLGVRPGRTHGNRLSEDSFVNLLLWDYVVLTNLTAVFALNETSNRRGLAQIFTHFSLLMLGAKSPHSENHRTSMGERSHRRKGPWRFTRQPCPHQTTSHLNGRCRK